MILHRFAYVTLRPAPEGMRRSVHNYGDVDVHVAQLDGVGEDLTAQGTVQRTNYHFALPMRDLGTARVSLDARVSCQLSPPTPGEPLPVPEEHRILCEKAIARHAALLGVVHQAEHVIFSPRPYLMLEPASDREVEWLLMTDRLAIPGLSGGGVRIAPGEWIDQDFARVLADRLEGVALLAAGLSGGQGVAKLHELMRVFENGFRLAGHSLVEPLTKFLQSYPKWELGYESKEVRRWIADLRHPATHADLRHAKSIVMDSDVAADLPRIEQAAYDVLFNKARWHHASFDRFQRFSFVAMATQTASVVAPGAQLLMTDRMDHFRAFRLDEACLLDTDPSRVPSGTLFGDWYHAHPDAQRRDQPTADGG